jgi:hypothetical protein
MAKLIDQKFVQKVQNLSKEILSDEARFIFKKDEKLAPLHNNLFTKANELPFQNIEATEREFFRKYFYLDGNINTPRPDVAFADSPEDQAFFFDQFRHQVKFCTYDYQRLDLLRPGFADEKADKPAFNADQSALLLKAIVSPVLHSLEQREIAILEQKKSGKLPAKEGQATENPYAELADKVLVKGESGQFDAIMTFAQLEEIAGQEAQLRGQGLSQEQVVQLLQEYINKRFPEFKIALTPEGKITTFLSDSGISASGLESNQSTSSQVSFADMLKEMKYRQTRQMQYSALGASNYNLSFPGAANFQVVGGSTTASLSGLSVKLDQSEQGNKAVFFLTDRQGVSAKVVVDTTEYRINGKPNFNFSLYQKPEIDSPASPKFKLSPDQLDQLKKPLLLLYQELQKTEEFDPAAEKMSFVKPATKVPPPNIPHPVSSGIGKAPTDSATQGAVFSLPNNFKSNLSPALQQSSASHQGNPAQPRSIGYQSNPTQSVKPKIPANQAALSPTSVKQESPARKVNTPNLTQQGQQREKSASLTSSAPQSPAKKHNFGKVALATGLPVLATLAGAAQQMLT